MRKLHKVSYGNIFTNNFDVKLIDGQLSSLQMDEQLRLIDHVVDYVYVNFKNLSKFNSKTVISEIMTQRKQLR